ncbi:hypothetical protein ACFXPI_27235 [Streptomyces sp. NPDC059104]|uniref:hypothetical protein n=1 Tax=Streptomyces sp. NPDC059104 TaxID=3346729 RepID=UPI003691BB99
MALNEFALPLTRHVSSPLVDPLPAGPLGISTWPASVLAVLGIWWACRRRAGHHAGDPAFAKLAASFRDRKSRRYERIERGCAKK